MFVRLENSRRELMRINGIPDGGQQETTANTTKLVTDLIKSIDPDLNESDIMYAMP
jgi:hypothetical protein